MDAKESVLVFTLYASLPSRRRFLVILMFGGVNAQSGPPECNSPHRSRTLNLRRRRRDDSIAVQNELLFFESGKFVAI